MKKLESHDKFIEWEEDVEKGLWAFMREETRKKRAGEVVD